MKFHAHLCFMAVLAALLVTSAHAQTPKEPTRTAADVITVVGCVQREADYRSQIADRKGGVAGTGLGASNEFVLRSVMTVSNVTLKPASKMPSKFEDVYSVTGNLERELDKAVGKQVAISGYVEVAETEGTPKVKDLPRLNGAGWHIVSDHCSAPPS